MSPSSRWNKPLPKTYFGSTYPTLIFSEGHHRRDPPRFFPLRQALLANTSPAERSPEPAPAPLYFRVSSPESKTTGVPTRPEGLCPVEWPCRGVEHFHRKRERPLFVLSTLWDISSAPPSPKKTQFLKGPCVPMYLSRRGRPVTSSSVVNILVYTSYIYTF